MDNEKIGEFIKSLRKEKGLSQSDLSEILHITRQAISNWETGKTSPDPELLIELSNYFKVPINAILLGEKEITEEKVEKVTLKLIGDNQKKAHKIKKQLIVFSTIIFILIFSFLAYYFITTYNSIKVYRVGADSKRFFIQEGMMIHAKKKTYIKIGNIEKKNTEDNINKIEVFLKDKTGKLKRLHYTSEQGIHIIEIITNNQISLNKLQTKLYLQITYNENEKELIKLNIWEIFKNDLKNYANNETNNVIRQVTEENKEIIQDKQIKPETEETINQELIQEKEIKLEYPVEEKKEEKVEEIPPEDNNKIDYNQIANILKEKGVQEQDSYRIQIENEEFLIVIKYVNNHITIESMQNDTILGYIISIDGQEKILYEKYVNYMPVEEKYIPNDENSEEIIKMKELIMTCLEGYL